MARAVGEGACVARPFYCGHFVVGIYGCEIGCGCAAPGCEYLKAFIAVGSRLGAYIE